MQFTASRKSIIEAIAPCLDVAKRGTNEFAQGILLAARNGAVHVTSIAPPLCITRIIGDAKVDGECSVVLKASALFDHIKAMPTADLTVAVAEGKATISAAGSTRRYVLQTADAGNFPKFPKRPDTLACALPGAVLSRLIDRVSYAVRSVGQFVGITGLYLNVSASRAEAAAVNNSGGMIVEELSPEGAGQFAGGRKLFIPADARSAVHAFVDTLGSQRVEAYWAPNRVHLVAEHGELEFALPEYTEVPVDDFIRRGAPPGGVEIDKVALLAALRAICVGAKPDLCETAFTLANGELSLRSKTAISDNTETVPASVDGQFSFHANAFLWVATLDSIDSDTVTIASNNTSATGIRAPGVVAIVMVIDPALAPAGGQLANAA